MNKHKTTRSLSRAEWRIRHCSNRVRASLISKYDDGRQRARGCSEGVTSHSIMYEFFLHLMEFCLGFLFEILNYARIKTRETQDICSSNTHRGRSSFLSGHGPLSNLCKLSMNVCWPDLTFIFQSDSWLHHLSFSSASSPLPSTASSAAPRNSRTWPLWRKEFVENISISRKLNLRH